MRFAEINKLYKINSLNKEPLLAANKLPFPDWDREY